MRVEQLRQRVELANREPTCDHRGDSFDFCDECKPVGDAQVRLMWEAPAALPALLDIAEAAQWYAKEPCESMPEGEGTCLEDDSLDPSEGERCGPCCARAALSRLDTEGGT